MSEYEALKSQRADIERRQGLRWVSLDECNPPDETDVLWFAPTALGDRIEIGRISVRCGTYGPSLATHWRMLPKPPEVQR